MYTCIYVCVARILLPLVCSRPECVHVMTVMKGRTFEMDSSSIEFELLSGLLR